MARAVWKGPFVEESLMKKVDKYKTDPKKIPIKTMATTLKRVPIILSTLLMKEDSHRTVCWVVLVSSLLNQQGINEVRNLIL